MSDFDREAERERLREQYERDKQDREATERMSDLLLKGATMTNAHCGTCGDPIFRYEGQEFCPTCQERVGDADGDQSTADAEKQQSDAAQPQADSDQQRANADQPPVDGQGAQGARPGPATADDNGAETTASSAESAIGDATAPEAGGSSTAADAAPAGGPETSDDSAAADDGSAPNGTASTTAGAPAAPGTGPQDAEGRTAQSATGPGESNDTATLSAARASLTRTVTTLARRAEASDDLERARAYLAAVEEAADALDAVKTADR
ncbi:MAG: Sjogren's syndrome/scleroderma autoantigen 1 family protein [Haloarculaceae archaeon]